jgi:hypothetical protein
MVHLLELIEISRIPPLDQKDIALKEYQVKSWDNTRFYCMRGKFEHDLGRFEKATDAFT